MSLTSNWGDMHMYWSANVVQRHGARLFENLGDAEVQLEQVVSVDGFVASPLGGLGGSMSEDDDQTKVSTGAAAQSTDLAAGQT